MSARSKAKTSSWIVTPLLIPLSLILGPILALYFAAYFPVRGLLYLMVWLLWCPQGKNVLFVYSDSTIWKNHIESMVLPKLSDEVVVLNWSERKRWKTSLATLLFHHFGGHYEFNPMALVFTPFQRRRQFRFFKAFQAWKKGDREALEAMESEFFLTLSRIGQTKGEQGGEAPCLTFDISPMRAHHTT